MNPKELETVAQLFADGNKSASNKISAETEARAKALLDEHKPDSPALGDFCIKGSMSGTYGHMEVIKLTSSSWNDLKGTYKGVLWNDDSATQPFNRQGVFYNGQSFGSMKLDSEGPGFRTFTYSGKENCHYSGEPWRYNDYYGTIDFRKIVKAESAEFVIKEFLALLGKEADFSFED